MSKSGKSHRQRTQPPAIDLPLDLDDLPSMADLMGEGHPHPPPAAVHARSVSPSKATSPNKTCSDDKPTRRRLIGEPSYHSPTDISGKGHQRQPHAAHHHITNSILDLGAMPAMDQLLSESSTPIEKSDTVKGVITKICETHCLVDIGFGETGVVPAAAHVGHGPLRVGDRIIARRLPPPAADALPTLIPERRVQRARTHQPKSRCAAAVSVAVPVIIDGSNVCRSYIASDGGSSLAPLLTLLLELVRRELQWRCFCDASESHMLARSGAGSESTVVYSRMLRDSRGAFREVDAGTSADDAVLAAADRADGVIVSNDRFNKLPDQHTVRYPWLEYGTRRLLKGSVIDGRVVVDALGIAVPLRTDLTRLGDEILVNLRS